MAPLIGLRAGLSDPLMGVMTFLNEVIAEFPDAISFAPGRPLEEFFDVETCITALEAFLADAARRSLRSRLEVGRTLGQYSRVNGIIGEIICEQLARDEQIHVGADAVMVTVGAQEAMAVLVAGLFEPGRDILLVSDPTYIGITGFARLLGVQVAPIPSTDEGLDPDDVARAIQKLSRCGRVRALYDIPDFNNPLGTTLSVDRRLGLLHVCERHGVLLIEDNAYGMFAYDGPRLPTIKSLDRSATVVYVGSFAKTLAPGLRLGYLIADQQAMPHGTLATALSRVKSLLTVNTPPLTQAIAAGMLIGAGGSLEPIVAPKRARYKAQRDTLAAALRERFASYGGAIAWCVPAGGFFMPLTLPFAFGPAELRRCALEHGVIICPMRDFCLDRLRERQVRLSFSAVDPPTIHRGVARLATFVRAQMSPRATYASA